MRASPTPATMSPKTARSLGGRKFCVKGKLVLTWDGLWLADGGRAPNPYLSRRRSPSQTQQMHVHRNGAILRSQKKDPNPSEFSADTWRELYTE